MTVAELIELLKTFPPEMRVAYQLHSEQKLIERDDIARWTGQPPRADGWIHDHWNGEPELPKQEYVLFPGN